MAIPKTLGGLEARYTALAVQIAGFESKIREAKAEQEQVLAAMKKLCDAQKIENHRGVAFVFENFEQERAEIRDMAALLHFADTHNAPDLLQKRAGVTACREFWSRGETVPGVERVASVIFRARALPKRGA